MSHRNETTQLSTLEAKYHEGTNSLLYFANISPGLLIICSHLSPVLQQEDELQSTMSLLKKKDTALSQASSHTEEQLRRRSEELSKVSNPPSQNLTYPSKF